MVKFDEQDPTHKLEEIEHKEQEDLAQILSKKYDVPYVDLRQISIDTDGLALIDEVVAQKHKTVVFHQKGKEVSVGTTHPGDRQIKEIIEDLRERGYIPTVYIVSPQSIKKALDHYQDLSYAQESAAGLLEISSEQIARILKETKNIQEIEGLIQETLETHVAGGISHIVEVIIASAVAVRASDVHIEPGSESVALRFRIDGILTTITTVNIKTYELMRSRIKLLSGLLLNVKDEAQDGRFTITIDEKKIEVRASMVPGTNGESIVLRVLDPNTISVPLENLGMRPQMLKLVKQEIAKPNGMILNTGPTGSGKTTSLYAFMKYIHKPGIKIITIEDPVEYHVEGIVQTQVDRVSDYTFLKGLRSSLRQDPDVMMIGEIREEETAQAAFDAALTGHLVFSTLHTNDAVGTFTRLIELGVENEIIGSALNLVMAQRLVRVLCTSCRIKTPITGSQRKTLETVLESEKDNPVVQDLLLQTEIYNHAGCGECNNTGYRERTGIFEAVEITQEVQDSLSSGIDEGVIRNFLISQGRLTLAQDGVLKVLEGITDLDELARVIDITRQ